MKVDAVEREIQRSDNFQEREMGLAKGSESFVFNVLRKDLYSDPIGSLIREYTVNAQDEHVKYGIDRPILIQAPTQFTPELHIRDYANGLTEEQVFTFFGQYGASDKRDSNEVVGFYGLGCKSAFAYTDSYVVKSYKDGIVYTFNIYIDETDIGKVAKITEEATDEPNGLLIIVPVQTKDIRDFQNKIIKTVTYFKTKPIIEGLSYKPEFEDKESKIEGDGWKFYGEGEAICIMGEIAYPINTEAIDDLESWEEGLLESDLHLYTNIGEVQVTASREALQMSVKTIEAIRKRLKGIKETMLEQAEKAFSEAKTLFEAKSLYYKTIINGGAFGRIIRDSGQDLVWNGITIDNNTIKFGDEHWASHYSRRYRYGGKGTIKENVAHMIRCGEDVNVYFDDVTDKKKLLNRRAETLLDGDIKNVIFLHTTDVKALEEILGMSVTELKSLNEVVPMAVVKVAGSGTDLSKRAKHMAKVFQLDIPKLMKGYNDIASTFWEVKDIDIKKGGIYIPISRFKPNLPRITDIDDLRRVLNYMKNVGININVPIYGLKNTDSVIGMIKFDDWKDKKITKVAEKYKEKYELSMVMNSDLLSVDEIDESKVVNEDTKKYISLYKEADEFRYSNLRDALSRIFREVNMELTPSPVLTELSETIKERYPLLPLISSHSRGEDVVIKYMKGIDSSGNRLVFPDENSR